MQTVVKIIVCVCVVLLWQEERTRELDWPKHCRDPEAQ